MKDTKSMTKREYANYIVDGFCKMQGLDRVRVTQDQWHYYMKYSSKLAVCLEFLGMLSEKDLSYSKCRGGIYDIDPETFKVISVREFLESLPDDDVPEREVRRLYSENMSLESLFHLFQEYNISKYDFSIDIRVQIDHVNKSVVITDRV